MDNLVLLRETLPLRIKLGETDAGEPVMIRKVQKPDGKFRYLWRRNENADGVAYVVPN